MKENILIPRNLDTRQEKLRQHTIKMLSEEVINGDFIFEEWMFDIPDNQIKVFTVNGNFYFMKGVNISQLPDWIGRIQYVYGSFSCHYLKLTTLKNCPKNISKVFNCGYNNLKTLEGGPIRVDGAYFCNNNELISLKGCPTIVKDMFDCANNELISLEYGPEDVRGSYNCYFNNLKTLKGTPKHINGHFNCSFNELTSLEDGPKFIGGKYICHKNELELELPDGYIAKLGFDN